MIRVRDYYSLVTPEVDLVKADTSIKEVIEIMSRNPASRSVYVVDENEKLVGVISVKEVLNILGAKYLHRRTITVLHEIMATTAADIMRDAECVGPDDDIEEGLKIAVMQNMEDIPVVEKSRVIGNLDCFELIKGIQAQHRQERDEEKKAE